MLRRVRRGTRPVTSEGEDMKRFRWLTVAVVLALIAVGCGRSDSDKGTSDTTAATPNVSAACKGSLKATDTGVTPTQITIQVMADVGSPLAPGLFQGNFDALDAFATYWNAHGGVGCRQLKVIKWDTKLSADESKNGLISACANAVAMVGGNAVFNPDMGPAEECKDANGDTTGVPDLSALTVDEHEMCSPLNFTIQGVSLPCPRVTGVQDIVEMGGVSRWYVDKLMKGTPLHGLYLVPGDLPTSIQSSVALMKAKDEEGIKIDDGLKVSGRDAQADYTPRVQALKAHGGNFVYDGSNDSVMINMRKEAKAQGVADQVKIWACSLSCYTKKFIQAGGSDVEGTYAWMQFLPFEEAGLNAEASRYVDGVGANKVDSFGAQAWQAAVLFKTVVDKIVEADGPNAITRAKILETLDGVNDFTANGWIGKKPLKGFSPCFVILQVRDGKWVRVYPEKKGTFDCADSNLITVRLDPVAEAAKLR